jgi:hypothetical protein
VDCTRTGEDLLRVKGIVAFADRAAGAAAI